MKNLRPALCLIPLALFFASCAKPGLRIALLTKLEAGSLVGASEMHAATLFLEDRAAAGKSATITIEPFDDGWEPTKAIAAFDRARGQGYRFFVTSHPSNCALALLEPMRKGGVFAMATGSTTNQLSGADDLILRNVPDVEHEQRAIAEYIARLPGDRVLVLRDLDNEAYTEPAIKAFRAALSGKTIVESTLRMSALDIGAVRATLSTTAYDTLYILVGSYEARAGSFAQISAALRPQAKIVFTPWLKTPALVETAGPALARSILPAHYPPRGVDRRIDDYVVRFRARFGYAPTFISLNVYAALEIMAAAWDGGARNPEAMKRWIIDKKTVPTSFGDFSFDSFGDAAGRLYFIEDPRGEFE